MENLKIFPECGFNADSRFGKKIFASYTTRGYIINKEYIFLYQIVDDKVYIIYLFSTKNNYIKLLK